jgi:hypothetical protein
MSEAALIWREVSFNVLYLITIWTLVIVMARRLNAVEGGDRPIAQRVLWAFALLGMLMIPKTVAYVVIAILAYRSLYPRVDASRRSGEHRQPA